MFQEATVRTITSSSVVSVARQTASSFGTMLGATETFGPAAKATQEAALPSKAVIVIFKQCQSKLKAVGGLRSLQPKPSPLDPSEANVRREERRTSSASSLCGRHLLAWEPSPKGWHLLGAAHQRRPTHQPWACYERPRGEVPRSCRRCRRSNISSNSIAVVLLGGVAPSWIRAVPRSTPLDTIRSRATCAV